MATGKDIIHLILPLMALWGFCAIVLWWANPDLRSSFYVVGSLILILGSGLLSGGVVWVMLRIFDK